MCARRYSLRVVRPSIESVDGHPLALLSPHEHALRPHRTPATPPSNSTQHSDPSLWRIRQSACGNMARTQQLLDNKTMREGDDVGKF